MNAFGTSVWQSCPAGAQDSQGTGQGKEGGYPEPRLLLEDVLADVLHLLQQSLALGFYQISTCHLVGSLARQLCSRGIITSSLPAIHGCQGWLCYTGSFIWGLL